jgi:hypothetical protein
MRGGMRFAFRRAPKVPLIADEVLPEPTLPDAALAFVDAPG